MPMLKLSMALESSKASRSIASLDQDGFWGVENFAKQNLCGCGVTMRGGSFEVGGEE